MIRGKSPHPQTGWIRQLLAGIMTVGLGGASAFAQASETSDTPSNPRVPNRSVQRLSRPTLRLESQGQAVSELQAMLALLGYYAGPVNGVYQAETQAAVAQFQQAAGLIADGVAGPATWSLLLPITPAQASPPTAPIEAPMTVTEATTAPVETASASTPSPEPDDVPNLDSPPDSPPRTPPNSNPSRTPSPAENPAPDDEAAPASPVELPILRRGMHGDAIARLQERLQALGIYNGSVDGVFGPETETAVKQAQRNSNLEVDGVVGPATWRAILR